MKKSKEQREREREIIAAYYDKRMRKLLEPLYEDFQRWKRGELNHDEICQKIHEFHKENQKLYSLFCQSREFLLKLIQLENGVPTSNLDLRSDLPPRTERNRGA